jgi:hypothetical protein
VVPNSSLNAPDFSVRLPFRIIDARGVPVAIADVSPDVLALYRRTLAIDGIRDVLWRDGLERGNLTRRATLKRIIDLFASAPNRPFSLTDLGRAMSPPGRDEAPSRQAVMANIEEFGRLLGNERANILRPYSDGYRFTPPADFAYVVAGTPSWGERMRLRQHVLGPRNERRT